MVRGVGEAAAEGFGIRRHHPLAALLVALARQFAPVGGNPLVRDRITIACGFKPGDGRQSGIGGFVAWSQRCRLGPCAGHRRRWGWRQGGDGRNRCAVLGIAPQQDTAGIDRFVNNRPSGPDPAGLRRARCRTFERTGLLERSGLIKSIGRAAQALTGGVPDRPPHTSPAMAWGASTGVKRTLGCIGGGTARD